MAKVIFNSEIFTEITKFHNENLKYYSELSKKIQEGNLDNGRVKKELNEQRNVNSETQKTIDYLESTLQKAEDALEWAKNSEENYQEHGTSSIINQQMDVFMDDPKVSFNLINEKRKPNSETQTTNDDTKVDYKSTKAMLKKKTSILLNKPSPILKGKKENSWDQKAIGYISKAIEECNAIKKLFTPESQITQLEIDESNEASQSGNIQQNEQSNAGNSSKPTPDAGDKDQNNKIQPKDYADNEVALRSISSILQNFA